MCCIISTIDSKMKALIHKINKALVCVCLVRNSRQLYLNFFFSQFVSILIVLRTVWPAMLSFRSIDTKHGSDTLKTGANYHPLLLIIFSRKAATSFDVTSIFLGSMMQPVKTKLNWGQSKALEQICAAIKLQTTLLSHLFFSILSLVGTFSFI